MIYKFYDTCSLLLAGTKIFNNKNEKPVISSITIQELEDIKSSNRKDEKIKYLARRVVRSLTEHEGEYDLHIFETYMLDPMYGKGDFDVNNDLRILATAFDYDYYKHPDETVFVTNDLVLKHIANMFFGEDSIESVEEE
jgi:hypothetical protein